MPTTYAYHTTRTKVCLLKEIWACSMLYLLENYRSWVYKMSNENWQAEYKEMKSLKPFQIKLLDEGANTLSQSWLLNAMWCEWKKIKGLKDTDLPSVINNKDLVISDPWE